MAENSSLSSGNVTKSLDQLLSQFSVLNIHVPRIDAYKDIFEFINEFETITATLPEDQQTKLLVKAFPPGRLRTWYENKLKPLVDSSKAWSVIKKTIINRYSDTEDRDRQLKRLQGMKYLDDGQTKLFDFVEEFLFTFDKVFKEDDDTKIRYVKSILPSSVSQILIHNNDFNNPTDLDQFLRGIRQFDKSRSTGNNDTATNRIDRHKTDELVKSIQELVKTIQGQSDRPKVAALRTPSRDNSPARESYPRANSPRIQSDRSYYQFKDQHYSQTNNQLFNPRDRTDRTQRSPSPGRKFVSYNDGYGSRHEPRYYPPSKNYDRPINVRYQQEHSSSEPVTRPYMYQTRQFRSPSPGRRSIEDNHMEQRYDQQDRFRQAQQPQSHPSKAFSDEKYYQRFGVPPKPCPRCNLLHWERHCPEYLN